jgi:hypothetical protein
VNPPEISEAQACPALAFLTLTVALALGAPPPPSTRQAPFIETFQRNGRTLIYVLAVHHSSVLFPDPMNDPVFKTIQSVFSKTPPDAVIVEGVDPSQMSGFLAYANQCAANYNLPGKSCDEPAFSANSAMQNGVPVYTGEPSARAVLSFFEAQGYSTQDFFALQILSNIPHEKRHGQLTEDKFRQLVQRITGNENHLLGISVRFTSEDFAAWYAKHMQIPINYLDITLEDTSPDPQANRANTVLHTLVGLSNKMRDRNIVATIKTVLQNHNRVLIVYGASHLDFEWEELVQFLGIPKKTKPF